ncbi:MAG TPA: kelch repeat-containing protein, partial [Methylomirabilota bacterium]|nr:kelch repeat-containing protein [Methylomirabilota bacterium]
ATGLHRARAGHTATVLPDGSVLVFGGVGADGRLVGAAEVFHPSTSRFELLGDAGLAPRAGHTATLLTDGRVLVAGGVGEQGVLLPGVELWSPRDRAAERVDARLHHARRGHTAVLLADGTVWIAGGADGQDALVAESEVFHPTLDRVTLGRPSALPSTTEAPRMTGSIPSEGEGDVPTEALLAVRFSRPVLPPSLSASTVRLTGPAGAEAAAVVAAEGGRLLFVTPTADLLAGAEYTLTLDGVTDGEGRRLPATALRFTTAAPPTQHHAGAGSGPFGRYVEHHGGGQYDLTPPGSPAERDEPEWRGERRHGQPYSPWQSLPPLQAPPGVTALAGQVLRLNGQPLAEVTLQIGARSTRTDRSGRFLLTDIPAGYPVLIMDGSTANRPGRTYGIFDYRVRTTAGQTTVLPFTIWMPLLDTAHAVALPVPTPAEVVVTSPRLPGLEVRIPAGVVLQTAGGPLRWMALTEIPVDRPPYPLPAGTTFFFTP